MTQSLDTTLTRAYELIEANRIDDARQLLEPLLAEYPEDADLWWVYAHAVEDPTEARRALDRVKQIDPEYPEVDQLLQEVEPVTETSTKDIKRIRPLAPPMPEDASAASPTGYSDEFDDFFEDDLATEEAPSSSGRSWLVWVLSAVVVIALIGLGYLLFLGSPGSETPTPPPQAVADATEPPSPAFGVPAAATEEITAEAQADVPTEEVTAEAQAVVPTDTSEPTTPPTATDTEETPSATETPEPSATNTETAQTEEATEDPETPTDTPSPTEETPTSTYTPSPTATQEPTIDPISEITAAFDDFELYNNPEIMATTAGETFLVQVCLQRGDDRSEILGDAMSTLAESAPNLPPEAAFAGIALYDCELETPLRSVAAPVDEMQAFQRGDINERDFQRTWQAVG